MDIKNLSKITDSTHSIRGGYCREIKDSIRRRVLKKKLKDALEETESTEQAVDVAVNALEGQEPAEVITAVVEILGDTIDKLTGEEITDNKKIKDAKGDVVEGAKGGELPNYSEVKDILSRGDYDRLKAKFEDAYHKAAVEDYGEGADEEDELELDMQYAEGALADSAGFISKVDPKASGLGVVHFSVSLKTKNGTVWAGVAGV